MSERPSSPAAGATTWRLTASPALTAAEDESAWKQGLLLANMAGFLGGYFVFYNQWLQLGWGLVMAVAWLMAGGHADLAEGLKKDRWLQAVVLLGAGLLVRSSVVESPGATLKALWAGWTNSLLLLGFLLTLWQAALRLRMREDVGKPMMVMAVVAAACSFVMSNFLGEGAFVGSRLQNWFVYGGWNSVNSGLTFAFAACWAVTGWQAAEGSGRRRWLLAALALETASVLTLSRGALLVLLTAHLALLVCVGWRRALRPLLLLLGVLALFQTTAPYLSRLAVQDAARSYEIQDERIVKKRISGNSVNADPIGMAVDRMDNGRFLIYSAAVNSMTGWKDWLLGKGMWAANDSWSCSLHWYPEHLHGVFWDTFVHGGLPAGLVLLGLTGWGLKRAWWLARKGEPVWFVLACGGLAGLVFDGDTLWALISVARYEPLLFWTPMVIASARFTAQRSKTWGAGSV